LKSEIEKGMEREEKVKAGWKESMAKAMSVEKQLGEDMEAEKSRHLIAIQEHADESQVLFKTSEEILSRLDASETEYDKLKGKHVVLKTDLETMEEERNRLKSALDESAQNFEALHAEENEFKASIQSATTKSSEELRAEALAVFRDWDRDGNDNLSHGEVKKGMKKLDIFKSLISSEDFHWKDLWAKYDTDNDGSVGSEEFVIMYIELYFEANPSATITPEEMLEASIKKCDGLSAELSEEKSKTVKLESENDVCRQVIQELKEQKQAVMEAKVMMKKDMLSRENDLRGLQVCLQIIKPINCLSSS